MPWLHGLVFHSRFLTCFVFIKNGVQCMSVIYVLIILLSNKFIQDLEFVQFHPTGIYGAGCLITEGYYLVLPFSNLFA